MRHQPHIACVHQWYADSDGSYCCISCGAQACAGVRVEPVAEPYTDARGYVYNCKRVDTSEVEPGVWLCPEHNKPKEVAP